MFLCVCLFWVVLFTCFPILSPGNHLTECRYSPGDNLSLFKAYCTTDFKDEGPSGKIRDEVHMEDYNFQSTIIFMGGL